MLTIGNIFSFLKQIFHLNSYITFLLFSEKPTLPSRINKSKPAVMLTGYESKSDEKLVKGLGGTITTIISECTVLVTNKICRTSKLLCALGKT